MFDPVGDQITRMQHETTEAGSIGSNNESESFVVLYVHFHLDFLTSMISFCGKRIKSIVLPHIYFWKGSIAPFTPTNTYKILKRKEESFLRNVMLVRALLAQNTVFCAIEKVEEFKVMF